MTFEKWAVKELHSILCKIFEIESKNTIESIREGDNISIDYTDPKNPIISSTTEPVDLTPIESRLTDVEVRVDTTEQQISQHSVDIGNLILQDDIIKDKIIEIDSDISAIKTNVDSITLDINEIEDEILTLNTKVNSNSTSISANTQDISQIKQKNVDQDNSISSINTKVNTNTQDIQTNKTALTSKLDKPTSNTTDLTTYKDLVVVNPQGNTAKLDVSTVGKVDKVMGIGPDASKNVDISGINPNWTGQHRYSNISDKKADLTYNRIGGFDNSGNMAVVGFPAIKDTFAGFTQAQVLELGQILNSGQGSEGAMSVNLISPPIVQNINSNEYILIKGANLNLMPTRKKIEILNATTKAVVATIPDNQIQLYADGLSLVFYYNFKDLPIGNYLIKLTSGIKIYITTLELSVVQNVEHLNLEAVTWEMIHAGVPDSGDIASGRNVSVNSPIIVANQDQNIKIACKSSELFAAGEDFYLEYKLTIGKPLTGRDGVTSSVGIAYSSTVNALLHMPLISTSYTVGYTNAYKDGTLVYNNGVMALQSINQLEVVVKIVKTGNLFRSEVGTNINQIILSNNAGYSFFLSIGGRASAQNVSVQLVKAYKFR